MRGPRSIAKLVQITPITTIYGAYSELVTGAYKPTYLSWGPHIVGLVTIFDDHARNHQMTV